jgi:hypothetical protein
MWDCEAKVSSGRCCGLVGQVTGGGGGKGGNPLQRSMAFHGCLGPSCRQADVMKACGVTQLLDAALAGYNVTIFAYGQVRQLPQSFGRYPPPLPLGWEVTHTYRGGK